MGYKSKDLDNFAATADKLGINYVGISDKEQMIDYINNKGSETARAEDQITYMSFFRMNKAKNIPIQKKISWLLHMVLKI